MFIAKSLQQKREESDDMERAKNLLKATTSLRSAERSGDPIRIAIALHLYKDERIMTDYFKYAIEWGILGEKKIDLYIEVKKHYDRILDVKCAFLAKLPNKAWVHGWGKEETKTGYFFANHAMNEAFMERLSKIYPNNN